MPEPNPNSNLNLSKTMPKSNPNSNLNLSKTGLWWCTWVLKWKKTSASQHRLTETQSYCDIYIYSVPQ